jgi:hypothetical protein
MGVIGCRPNADRQLRRKQFGSICAVRRCGGDVAIKLIE